jgi:aspartyl/glutamyl-tRNA(Asn/Gln) amidotransferase C subunit
MTETGSVNIAALAKLARLDVPADEMAKLEAELPGILSFVETIQNADVSAETKGAGLHNVMRVDENPHEGGLYTERLLSAAPVRDKDRIAVKQVVSRKK